MDWSRIRDLLQVAKFSFDQPGLKAIHIAANAELTAINEELKGPKETTKSPSVVEEVEEEESQPIRKRRI